MKLKIRDGKKEKELEVDFWSFFKCTMFSFLVMYGILFCLGFIFGMLLFI